jgi:serine/threonine protein kinase
VDVRSDIYSLGVTFYHSVVGEVPFSGDDQMEIMAKQILSSLETPRMRKLSPYTRYLIEKMMAKDARHRYQSPGAIVEDIDAHLGEVSTVFEVDTEKVGEKDEKPRSGKRPRITPTRRKDVPAPRRRGRADRTRRRRRR